MLRETRSYEAHEARGLTEAKIVFLNKAEDSINMI